MVQTFYKPGSKWKESKCLENGWYRSHFPFYTEAMQTAYSSSVHIELVYGTVHSFYHFQDFHMEEWLHTRSSKLNHANY